MRFRSDKGFTLIEIAIVLTIIMGVMAFLYQTVLADQVSDSEVAQIKTNMRQFQKAVQYFVTEFDRVPTTQELYETFLKGRRDLGFTVVDASNMAGYACGTGCFSEEMQPYMYLIVMKSDFYNVHGVFYAIDDHQPDWAPKDNLPFDSSLTQS